MYKTIQNNPPTNNLWIMPYEDLSNNSNCKKRCDECFPNELTYNCMIIYIPSEEGIIVLGYYEIEELHITESPRFELIGNRTELYFKKNDLETLKREKCFCISSWVFDFSLRNQECLSQICSHMLDWSSPAYLLWFEGKEELVFYPRNRKNRAIECFVNAFINE